MVRCSAFKVRISQVLLENYYYIVFILYSVSMFVSRIRVGLMVSFLILGAIVTNICPGRESKIVIARELKYPLMYIVWCALSIFWFDYSGVSVEAYFQTVSNAMFPMFFLFSSGISHEKFWSNTLYAYDIAGSIGTVLLIIRPSWYVNYCLSRGFDYRRLSFAYGSIIMGTMGAVSVIIALRIVLKTNGKKGTISYIMSCLFAFLSMQRSAWIVVLSSLIIAHYYIFVKYRMLKLRFLVFEVFALIMIFEALGNHILVVLRSWMEVRLKQYEDVFSVGNAISERSEQWMRGLENSNCIIGSGFGSRGHKAASSGFVNYIADGNWILLICELGIVGLMILMIACFKALERGLRNFEQLFLAMGVILVFIFQAVGSNVWEQQLIAPLFWFAMGEILSYQTICHS